MSELDNIIEQTSTSLPMLDHHWTIDEIELWLVKQGAQLRELGGDLAIAPLIHRFAPGMYVREIFMPAGVWFTTRVHKTGHPFVIVSGLVSIYLGAGETQLINGPFVGITEPGTRRVIYTHEDTKWITFHATHLTDLVAIESELTVTPHPNKLLAEYLLTQPALESVNL